MSGEGDAPDEGDAPGEGDAPAAKATDDEPAPSRPGDEPAAKATEEEPDAVATDADAVSEGPLHPRPSAVDRYLAVAPRYLALLDFAAVPKTKAGWILRVVATFAALLFLQRRVLVATHVLMTTKAPPAIPTEEVDDYRFRLPERTRREIFADLAAAEIAERARAIKANSWGGHLWSREDDRGHYERVAARAAAAKYKVSLTQVYLVLDEGIRSHWLGPDGQPLSATTPPLNIRSNSW